MTQHERVAAKLGDVARDDVWMDGVMAELKRLPAPRGFHEWFGRPTSSADLAKELLKVHATDPVMRGHVCHAIGLLTDEEMILAVGTVTAEDARRSREIAEESLDMARSGRRWARWATVAGVVSALVALIHLIFYCVRD